MEQLHFISEGTLFALLTFITGYTLLLSLSGWIGYKSIIEDNRIQIKRYNRIAILIPAYKEDSVIEKVATHMKQLDYPKKTYDVFVIADSMKESTIKKISKQVEVIEVSFDNSTKSNSLNYALNKIEEHYDIAIISDGDNILDESFLKKINRAYNLGAKAIQGHRIAKNTNTKMAVLDAASEEINNHIYRRGLNGLGLSSAIIGSGMAFDFTLLKRLMQNNHAVGGFDKILQLELLENRVKIEYIHEAIIYDEKVETIRSFQNQRKRWISAQIKYLIRNFSKGWKQLYIGNFDYFNISVICGIMPPRAFLVALFLLIVIIVMIFPQSTLIGSTYWAGLTFSYVMALIICIPRMIVHPSFLLALLYLPATLINMILALLKIKKADEKFIHTEHSNSTISNVFHKNGS